MLYVLGFLTEWKSQRQGHDLHFNALLFDLLFS